MTLWRFLVIMSFVGIGYFFFKDDPTMHGIQTSFERLIKYKQIRYYPGILVPNGPQQVNSRRPSIAHGKYELEPVAVYAVRGRVLSKKKYWFDREADVAPVDVVLGWGPMSDEATVERVSVSQGLRHYEVDYNIPGMNVKVINLSTANIHLIAAEKNIENAIETLKEGDIVSLSGFLVNAKGNDNWVWRTSMSRDDLGENSDELLYVDRLVVLTGNFQRVE